MAAVPNASNHIRIARPSRDLASAERFWAGGLGLGVLYRSSAAADGGHALIMLGWPDAAWHLELVADPLGETPASPTEEDLLVLYLDGQIDDGVVGRLVDHGGVLVAARNPYWDRWGVTIEDPDGYRLLSHRSWA
jgi:catechol 2,3-dioxygenase-like lactoylglutathione lyase family enzyme